MSYKCRARIELLNALEKLQQRQNDAKGMQKTFLLRRKYINHLNNINRLFPTLPTSIITAEHLNFGG